jgi:hypothetical protein
MLTRSRRSAASNVSSTPDEYEKAKIRFAEANGETPASQAKTPGVGSTKFQLLSPTPIDPYIGPHDGDGLTHLQSDGASVSPMRVGSKSASCIPSPQGSEASSDSVSDFFAKTKSAHSSPISPNANASAAFKPEVQQLHSRFQESALPGSHRATLMTLVPNID